MIESEKQNQELIAYIIPMKNGINRFIYREIKLLIEHGINITLFPVRYEKGPYMPESTWNIYLHNPIGIIFFSILSYIKNPVRSSILMAEAIESKSLIDLLIALDFSYYMKKKGITKIHCHFADHRLFAGYYCKKILQIPLSVTVHAYELYNNPNPVMFIKSLNACNNIIAISEYNKEILTAKFGLDREKISVVRLFVEEKNISDDLTKILIVGRYVRKKGHDVLFKAIKLLGRKDIHLWVAGIGDYSNLRTLAKDLEIEDKITFFGTVSDEVLDLLYSSCDIFCLPSREDEHGDKEGIPVALMEAMSYGKPVISTKHAGIPELVKDVLVRENSADDLKRAINELADKVELRKQQGKINREIIQRKYSENNLLQLKNIFFGTYHEIPKEN